MECRWFDIEGDVGGWDSLLAGTGSNIFHRGALLAVHQFGDAIRRGLLIEEGGRFLAAVGGLQRCLSAGIHFTTLSFPAVEQSPPTNFLSPLLAQLRSERITHVTLGSYNGGVEVYRDAAAYGRMKRRLEFVYDLDEPEDERWRRLSSNHRRKLNKPPPQPLHLQSIDRYQAWRMSRLHATWASRHDRREGLSELIRTHLYHRRLVRELVRRGQARLYGLFDSAGLLSFAFMLEEGNTAYYMIGASSQAGYRVSASIRLFWELARHYQGRGIRRMNLGGVPEAAREEGHEEHGVYRFKAGFGIRPITRHSMEITL